jgi:hypothetical protein
MGSRRGDREHARGRAVFPRRRTERSPQPTPSSLRQGAPVSRPYAPVEKRARSRGRWLPHARIV